MCTNVAAERRRGMKLMTRAVRQNRETTRNNDGNFTSLHARPARRASHRATMSSPPTQETPVAVELVQTLREMREMRAALAKRDAELEDSRAKRAKLETEFDAMKAELEAMKAMHPTLNIDGNIACKIFVHVTDPKDRIRLAAVSKVFQEAEKADASLPVAPSELRKLGVGIHKITKRLYWYRAAADHGDSEAMYAIGTWYSSGLYGVKHNLATACEWFKNASELGLGKATRELAWCYVNGRGVRRDEKKAIELYIKSAGQGDHSSADCLGHTYYNGQCGMAVNITSSLKWFRVAAELGSVTGEKWVDAIEAAGQANYA